MQAEQVRRMYRRFLLELWHTDLDRLEEVAALVVSPDFVIHHARLDGANQRAVRGPRAVAELVRDGRAPFTDSVVDLDVGPLVEGDRVAARWTFEGSYGGQIPGATAEPGTRVRFGGMDLLRVEGDRFVEYWVSSDGVHLLSQLGLLPYA